jgi:hypothetical protein
MISRKLLGLAATIASRRTAVSNPAIQAAPLVQQSYTPNGQFASK